MATDKLNRWLIIGIAVVFAITSMTLMVVVAQQRVKLQQHGKMLDFMNEGSRFTYTDGRVLFLMCNGFEAGDRVKNRVSGIYNEHGSTDFHKWLQSSNYLK